MLATAAAISYLPPDRLPIPASDVDPGRGAGREEGGGEAPGAWGRQMPTTMARAGRWMPTARAWGRCRVSNGSRVEEEVHNRRRRSGAHGAGSADKWWRHRCGSLEEVGVGLEIRVEQFGLGQFICIVLAW